MIAILLRRGNKNVDIKFSAHERFWNNLHQVAQNRKFGKPNNVIVLGAQYLWVLMPHSPKLLRTVFIFPDNVGILCLFCNVL
jgi:hypothetical protein